MLHCLVEEILWWAKSSLLPSQTLCMHKQSMQWLARSKSPPYSAIIIQGWNRILVPCFSLQFPLEWTISVETASQHKISKCWSTKGRPESCYLENVGLFYLASLCIDCLCMQRVWLGRRLDLAHHKIASTRRCHILIIIISWAFSIYSKIWI